MLLRPLISPSGKTQWVSSLTNFDGPNDIVEFSFDLYFRFIESEVVQHLSKRLAESEFDWMYVVRDKIRIDADQARAELKILEKHAPWFRGVLELTPEIHQGERTTHVSISIHKDSLRSVTVSGGGFSIAPNSSLFRRLVTWVPLVSVVSWSVFSFYWESSQAAADGFFSASGAFVAVGGGWVDLWNWLWRRHAGNQPIQPGELTATMIVGFSFVLIGSTIWAYGGWLV